MKRIQVTVTDEAGEVISKYKTKNKLKSLDDAVDKFLLEFQERI